MKALKRFTAVVASLALTVGMCVSVFAGSTWGDYIGFDGKPGHTWYEAADGKFTQNSDTSWTCKMKTIGWGGVWGCQVFQDAKKGNGKVDIKKGQEYKLQCTLKSSDMDKWVVVKVATKENIAFAKWVKLKKGQNTTINETFTAKCDATSIYFGLGGDFGDRADEKDLYTYAEGGAKSISDGNSDAAGKGTTITCTGYSLESTVAAAQTATTAAAGQGTQSGQTGTVSTAPSTVATGDFTPIACAAAAVVAASVIVVFARKRENN